LCITTTSAPSERIFSTAKNIITDKRANMDAETAGVLIFLNRSMKD
jgi:hypothetical protein